MWELPLIVLLLPSQTLAQIGELNPDEKSLFAFVSFVPDPPPMPPPSPPPRPVPGSRDGCSSWSEWQQVACWWPDQPLSSVAPACANAPNRTEWPDYINKLVQAKSEERYSMIVDEYKKRGEPPKCGFCTRSFECRARNDTSSRRQCLLKEVREIQRSCDDSKPCELSVENGGCPPPAFLARGRLGQLQGLLQHGKFQDFATQFFEISGMDLMGTKRNRKGRSFDNSQNSIWDASDSTRQDRDDNYRDGQIDPRQLTQLGPERSGRNPFGPGQGRRDGYGLYRPAGRVEQNPFGPVPDSRERWRPFGPGRQGEDGPSRPEPPRGRGTFGQDSGRGRSGRFGPSGGGDGPFGPPGQRPFGQGGTGRGEPFGLGPHPGGDQFGPRGDYAFSPGRGRPYEPRFHGRRGPFEPSGRDREGEFGPGGKYEESSFGPGGKGGERPFRPGLHGGGTRFIPGGDKPFQSGPPDRAESSGTRRRGGGPFGPEGRRAAGPFAPGRRGEDRFGPDSNGDNTPFGPDVRGGDAFVPSSWESFGPAADQPYGPGPRGGARPPGPKGWGGGGPGGPGGRAGGPSGPSGRSGNFGASDVEPPNPSGRPGGDQFGPESRLPVPGSMEGSFVPGSEDFFGPEAKRSFNNDGTTAAARSRRSFSGQPCNENMFPSMMFNASWPSFPLNSPPNRAMKRFRPPTQRRNQKQQPPPSGALDMIADLLHGTTCVSTGEKCLCCCGYYVPNLLTGTCEDVRNVMPGIDSAYKELAKTRKKKQR